MKKIIIIITSTTTTTIELWRHRNSPPWSRARLWGI